MNHASTNRIREKMSDKAGQWTESASEAMQAGAKSARETIESNPASAVFTAFAAGFGVGLGLALVFAARSSPPMDYGLREKLSEFMNEHMPWMRR